MQNMFQLGHGGIFRGLLLSSNNGGFSALLWYSSLASSSSSIGGKNRSNFIVDYLMDKLGFSKKEAMTASSKVSRMKSAEKPDSVIKFLSASGIDKAHIKTLVSSNPAILMSNVEKTIEPKTRVLLELGLKGHEIVTVMVRDHTYLGRGLKTHIIPTIEIYKKSGLSKERLIKLMTQNPRNFLGRPTWIQDVMERVENQLGIPRDSGMFIYGVDALASLSKKTLESRFELFKSFGWSEDDILMMARKFPYCLRASDENLKKRLNYFMNELGFKAEYVATNPCLLKLNLEKKVFPRTVVFMSLIERKLMDSKRSYVAAMCRKESDFLKAYVLKFKDQAPDIYDAYVKAIGSPAKKVLVKKG